MADIIAAIIAFLVWFGSVIGLYIKINSRIQKNENDIVNINEKFKELEKTNDKIWKKLEQIDEKLDHFFENFIILKTQHDAKICEKISSNNNPRASLK